jgi:hypothetical protein
MADSVDVWSIVGLPVLSGICHIAMPGLTERLMSAVAMVRAVGVLLLISAIPCLVWRGWYFRTLFVSLAVSGFWRLCFPQSSIRAQQWTYPCWVHGCLLLGGAALVWTLQP